MNIVYSDVDIMARRARRIFDSCLGPLEKSEFTPLHTKYHQYLDDSLTVFFTYKTNNNNYYNHFLKLFVEDMIINIPIEQITPGMSIFNSWNVCPGKGVTNVQGEIADFIADYFDEYGYLHSEQDENDVEGPKIAARQAYLTKLMQSP